MKKDIVEQILKHIHEIIFMVVFCFFALFFIYKFNNDNPSEIISNDSYDKLIEMDNKIRLLSHSLNAKDFRVGGLNVKSVEKYKWDKFSAYIYPNKCVTTEHIKIALINNDFKDVWVAINNDKFAATACFGDVNLHINAKPQGGELCSKLNIDYNFEKNINSNNPQCWDIPKQSNQDNKQ